MADLNPERSYAPMAEVVESDTIAGVIIVTPRVHSDARGWFSETYRRSWFPDGREMVQGNRSDKVAGSLVGLHYHLHQADYWYVPRGRARVVLHDLREGSPTDGSTLSMEIGDDNQHGVYIPPGVAHGFAAVTDLTITYLVDQYYSPEDELGVAWDDPEIGADWGVDDPVLSGRDQANPRRADIPLGARPLLGSRPVWADAPDAVSDRAPSGPDRTPSRRTNIPYSPRPLLGSSSPGEEEAKDPAPEEVDFVVYLDTSDRDRVDAFLHALRHFWETAGLREELERTDPTWGSFRQRFRLRFSNRRAARAMFDAITAQYAGIPQAEANKAAAQAVGALVEHVKDPALPTVVLQARDQILLKFTPPGKKPLLVVKQLTPEQRERLDTNPDWLSDPLSLLRNLAEPLTTVPVIPPGKPDRHHL